MMRKTTLFKALALVACLLCSLSTVAAEAYAVYTPSNTTLTFYYDNSRSSRQGTTYDLNTGGNYPGWLEDGNHANVTSVVFKSSFANARPTTTYYWFGDMGNLVSITGISYLNTSEVTSMCMMFYNCTKLASVDVSHFNTAKVTNMEWLFGNCRALTSLDLSNFNTAKITSMSGMFYCCNSLTSLDLRSFNTSQVTSMMGTFTSCYSLTSLDVTSFNTSKVINMGSMFQNCSSLTSLDLSSFTTEQLQITGYMFCDCSNLVTIYARDWNTENVVNSTGMFGSCYKLVGGAGTVYDYVHWSDIEYARIDRGPSAPGYFTAKSIHGDINGDTRVDVGDVTLLINYVLNSTPVDNAIADLNGDNRIDVADVTTLIQLVLNN